MPTRITGHESPFDDGALPPNTETGYEALERLATPPLRLAPGGAALRCARNRTRALFDVRARTQKIALFQGRKELEPVRLWWDALVARAHCCTLLGYFQVRAFFPRAAARGARARARGREVYEA